jgi:hypothetical protein
LISADQEQRPVFRRERSLNDQMGVRAKLPILRIAAIESLKVALRVV